MSVAEQYRGRRGIVALAVAVALAAVALRGGAGSLRRELAADARCRP